MSWAAHDVEPYAIQRHMNLKVAFVPLLIGSYAPDMFTSGSCTASTSVPGTSRHRIPHSSPGMAGLWLRARTDLRRFDRPSHLEGVRQPALGGQLSDRTVGACTYGHGRHSRHHAALSMDAPLPPRRLGVRRADR